MSIDLSLDRLEKLVIHLPPYTRPTIHIAGTNGKGSVSALLTSILLVAHTSTPSPPASRTVTSSQSSRKDPSQPLRVGRFNSPHLTSILDSITIDNIPVAQATYDHVRAQVEAADQEHGTQLSSFEILTLTALQIFEGALLPPATPGTSGGQGQDQVDIVVLEVGMGGRLDATNIVPSSCIIVSALTAVDLDHQAFLGNSVGAIAAEKAGIARPGRPFVIGPQAVAHTGVVQEVVKEVVGRVGGEVVEAVKVHKCVREQAAFSLLASSTNAYASAQRVEFTLPCFDTPSSPTQADLPLHGAHQLDNLATALGVISALLSHPSVSQHDLCLTERITSATIRQGIESVKWPGRLSFHRVSVRLEGSQDFDDNSAKTEPQFQHLLVLVDGAHNAASAQTLGHYVAELLDATRRSLNLDCRLAEEGQTQEKFGEEQLETVELPITYILALSHSPPKTPLDVLQPLLLPISSPFSAAKALSSPNSLPLASSGSTATTKPSHHQHSHTLRRDLKLKPGIALLPFTPPAGMPWVKPVPPAALREAVQAAVPDIEEQDVYVLDTLEGQGGAGGAGDAGARNRALEDALAWAAGRHAKVKTKLGRRSVGATETQDKQDDHEEVPGLVVLAGSLYLVADFYRLLDAQAGRN